MYIAFSGSHRRAAAFAAGAVFAALLTAGCSHDDTPPPTVVTTPPTTTVVTPAPGTTTTVPGTATPDTKVNVNAGPGSSNGTDTALADSVNTAIVHNKQMTGSRVEVVATGGVVTLTGQVQNQQQKALAEKTASQVPGVAPEIKNKLIIVSTGGAKPIVITKTKTVIVHDSAAPASPSAGAGDMTPPTPPAAPDTSSAPNTAPAPNTSSAPATSGNP